MREGQSAERAEPGVHEQGAASGGAASWAGFADVYHRLGAPLRPSPSDVAAMADAIAGCCSRVALFGVTPELAMLGDDLTALDSSPAMLRSIWIGDCADRRALLAEWSNLPFASGSITAAIGDGALNSAPDRMPQILGEASRVLGDNGRAVFRAFCAPEVRETLDQVRSDVEQGWAGNFHALKWRIAMALVAADGAASVPARNIRAAFEELFPSRTGLVALTGWRLDEIGTIDAYARATHSLAFPTLSALLRLGAGHFDHAHVIEAKGYPLAERCPTIVWSKG